MDINKWKITAIILLLALIVLIMYIAVNPEMDESLKMLGIIGTVSTLILGIVAIALSIHFYIAGIHLNNSTYNHLSRIEAQTNTSAEISKGLLQKLMSMMEVIVTNRVQTSLRDEAVQAKVQTELLSKGEQFVDKAGKKLNEILKAKDENEKEEAKRSFFNEIDKMLKNLRNELGMVTIMKGFSPVAKVELGDDMSPTISRKSLLSHLPSFIRRMRDIEDTHSFVSVHWLKNTKFKDDPVAQELLQTAIDNAWLITQKRQVILC